MFFDIKNLKGGYNRNVVFDDVSFGIDRGQMLYVLGANGCGKTTLFNIIVGYKEKMDGSVTIGNEELGKLSERERARRIAYIPQHHVPAFNYTVSDIVVMGRASLLSLGQVPKKEDYRVVLESLKMLGIEELAEKEYKELSGGQRQLVLIARAICQQAKIIIMDEPLQSLDFVNQDMVINALRRLLKQEYTIIMSTHTAINRYEEEDKVLLMSRDGSSRFGNIEEVINGITMTSVYSMPVQTIFGEDGNGDKYLFCLPIRE
jgi:iron complex transport system ATP-binding protein